VSVLASIVSAGWLDVRGVIVEGRLTDFYHHSATRHVVAFLLSGRTRVEWKRGGRFTRSVSEPGSLTIIPGGAGHHFRTDRRARALLWMIDPDCLQSIAEQEWGPGLPKVDIPERFNSRDAEFWTLGHRLTARMLCPIPGARLYADALNTQLAIHLLWNYSSLPRPNEARAKRLNNPPLRPVTDSIYAEGKGGPWA
jgi:hypothetical protein